MFSIAHLLIGLGMVAIGVVMVKYTFQMANATGRQEWIERFTGSGSTYGVYKLFGVLLVVAGLLFATGFGDNVMNFIFSPLKKVFTPPTS